MKPLHLRGRKVNALVLRKGNVWKGSTMIIRWLPGSPRQHPSDSKKTGLFVGTLASTKLDKSAVKRNRMRRRCREALRRVLKDMQEIPTVQLLVSPRSSSLSAPFPVLEQDFRKFLSTLSSWPQQHAKAVPPSSSHSSSPLSTSAPTLS